MFSLKGLGGELVAEFFGTMVLLLFGDGVVASTVLYGLGNGAFPGWLIINFGWCFAVVFGIYVAGTVTGAHINPAVTLAFALRRGFAWSKVIPYWIAQVAGAFVAAAILLLEYSPGFNGDRTAKTAGVFFTAPHTTASSSVFPGITVPVGIAFFDQVLGTALLLGLILAVVDTLNQPPQANMTPLIIGFIVFVIGTSFGADAGYAINPARDFGPRLLAWIAGYGSVALPGVNNYFWVPIVGPLIGGAIGAFGYDFTIHKVLEARMVPPSGTAVEEGVIDRVPSPQTEARGRTTREP
jgi:glycerol uptake facilitator protein